MIRFQKKPRLKKPILIAGWPGMGQVALKATSYLKEKLKAKEFAYIKMEDFFQPNSIFIEKGLITIPKFPKGKFYYWQNPIGANDIIIFLSDVQPTSEKGYLYAHKVLEINKDYRLELIFTFAAMPLPIDHTQESDVWATATHERLIEELKRFNIKLMGEGEISGLNGLFLGVAKEKNIKGICLLAEIPLYTIQIENPKASRAILKVLAQILNIKIDLQEIDNYAKYMEEEIDKLIDYLRDSVTKGPISDEEIEKIKKSLSLYTKLPQSAKDRIEKLFEEAKTDISRANELKKELDKWNVYKEYEDRFLDLFKKIPKKDN